MRRTNPWLAARVSSMALVSVLVASLGGCYPAVQIVERRLVRPAKPPDCRVRLLPSTSAVPSTAVLIARIQFEDIGAALQQARSTICGGDERARR